VRHTRNGCSEPTKAPLRGRGDWILFASKVWRLLASAETASIVGKIRSRPNAALLLAERQRRADALYPGCGRSRSPVRCCCAVLVNPRVPGEEWLQPLRLRLRCESGFGSEHLSDGPKNRHPDRVSIAVLLSRGYTDQDPYFIGMMAGKRARLRSAPERYSG